MESIKEFYLTGEGFSESRLYEMKMLCREFFPGADIRQDPCDCNLIWKDGVWTLTEKNGQSDSFALTKNLLIAAQCFCRSSFALSVIAARCQLSQRESL